MPNRCKYRCSAPSLVCLGFGASAAAATGAASGDLKKAAVVAILQDGEARTPVPLRYKLKRPDA